MEIKFAPSFFDSLKRMRRRERWYWKTWDFFKYDVPRGVKNLRRWFKIIWKDRDYDSFFIFEILEHKLRNQAEYIGSRDIHTRAQRDAWLMRVCGDLIKNIKDDVYQLEYQDYNVMGKGDQWLTEVSNNYQDYFDKYKHAHRRAVQHIKDNQHRYTSDHTSDSLVALVMGQMRHDHARKLLFKIMEENIEGWWD